MTCVLPLITLNNNAHRQLSILVIFLHMDYVKGRVQKSYRSIQPHIPQFTGLHLYFLCKRSALQEKAQSSFIISSFSQNATNGYILSFKSTQTSLGGKLDLHFFDYKVCFHLEEIGRERRKDLISVLFKKGIIEKKEISTTKQNSKTLWKGEDVKTKLAQLSRGKIPWNFTYKSFLAVTSLILFDETTMLAEDIECV